MATCGDPHYVYVIDYRHHKIFMDFYSLDAVVVSVTLGSLYLDAAFQ